MQQLTIYSKKNCQYCEKAIDLLDGMGIIYDTIKVDEQPEAREFLVKAGHRAVPQIYLNGELFVSGGYQGLVKLTKDEILNKLQ